MTLSNEQKNALVNATLAALSAAQTAEDNADTALRRAREAREAAQAQYDIVKALIVAAA